MAQGASLWEGAAAAVNGRGRLMSWVVVAMACAVGWWCGREGGRKLLD